MTKQSDPQPRADVKGHDMTSWDSTIIRDRFGQERECKKCGGYEAKWGQGGYHKDDVLRKPCPFSPLMLALTERWT
jgi:hypothetical protein